MSLKEHLAWEIAEGKRMVAEGTPKQWEWLTGSMERYTEQAPDGRFDGRYSDNLYRFIRKEAEDLFKGFDDDSPDNRASYAAALFQRIAEARGQGSNTSI